MIPRGETAGDSRNSALLGWYRNGGRDLPWRHSTDPYTVMVSEVMLQQTQVPRAIPRFVSFVERWPTVHDLAGASNAEVLSEWSGLGYNTRALRLRDAAAKVADSDWPTTPEDLQGLPGIGPYTANAIASISFGAVVPAIDTNLRRVLSRWAGVPLAGADLRAFAEQVVGAQAGDWNQALMDLGSTLCTPRDPSCEACPVSSFCIDPSVYAAPQKQTRFDGSNRQLRGALVRGSLEGADLSEVGAMLGRSDAEVQQMIETLASERLIERAQSDSVA